MIPINCDIGERGSDHPLDLELMGFIDIANIACGGHAGDAGSVRVFRSLAERGDIAVAAHLSYPDREYFGRKSIAIEAAELLESLTVQYEMMPDVQLVKFHGALYNDSCARTDLAETLSRWLSGTACRTVITAPASALAMACDHVGIAVLAEAFAERRYQFDPSGGTLSLVSRQRSWASIHNLEEALRQARQITETGEVTAVVEADGTVVSTRTVPLKARTLCIHSDSEIALDLARELRR